MYEIKLLIEAYQDRKDMLNVLANNGYKTWCEHEKIDLETIHYVCFEVDDKDCDNLQAAYSIGRTGFSNNENQNNN